MRLTVFVLLSLLWQGDEADCFYIVESGEVKIMIRSKVSKVQVLKLKLPPTGEIKWSHFYRLLITTLIIGNLVKTTKNMQMQLACGCFWLWVWWA